MIKIIWSKDELTHLKEKLNKHHIHFVVLDEQETLPKDMIGIEIDQDHQDTLKKIFQVIEYEKMQMFFPTNDGFVQLHLQDIYYLESFGEDIYAHVHGKVEVIKKPLYQLEEMLKPYHFIRISKSYIVNTRKINYIKVGLNAKLKLELKDGSILEVTRSFVKSFKESLNL
ncbi:hypothetical protein BK011_03380 [Tenericutes bacterium MZ-XQ]|jgi:DNA-binding LytR/AlgR family response regulator|nr:hypothetical protein BK011_03380 [Tenericutes bacterium MZ-XQ]